MKSPLKGFTFVFTGEMEMSRDKARECVILLGGRVTTSISGKTTHLVVGNDPGESKIITAKKLGVKIINEIEFINLVEKDEINEVINTKIGTASEEIYYDKKKKNFKYVKLVEKYRPKRKEELIGNKNVLNMLDDFLKEKSKYKAAILIGSPGIGKTSAAHLLSKLNGYEIIEFNASSLRNKTNICEKVSEFIGSKVVFNKKRVIIMDEVDGMSSDRGGIGELINIIKKTKDLVICICNDATHQKIRNLANHCLNLRFRKPDPASICKRIKEIIAKEQIDVPTNVLNEVIRKCSGDLRYVLNTISLYNIKVNDIYEKDVTKNIFEITREIFQNKSVSEKINLYFEDYSLVPLFVHENYIKARPRSGNKSGLDIFNNSAESISYADTLDSLIYGAKQEWSLMPYHAFYSCVLSTKELALNSQISFSSYFANISKYNKNSRIFGNLAKHTSISKNDIILYAGHLIDRIFLKELKSENISGCITLLEKLDLTKEDVIELNSIYLDDYKFIPTKIKNQLTKEAKKKGRNDKNMEEIDDFNEDI